MALAPAATKAPIAGFNKVSGDPPKHRRLIMLIDGEEKKGKTNLSLTAPGGIALFNNDGGAEGVVEKFAKEKDIYIKEYEVDYKPGTDVKTVANVADQTWQAIQNDTDVACAAPLTSLRTIVKDTSTLEWEICRLSYFGKLDQVKAHHYGPVNLDFKKYLKRMFKSNKNIILLHRVKDEWIDVPDGKGGTQGKRTGEKITAGFNDMGYEVQVVGRCWRNMELGDKAEEQFCFTILECRQNANLVGKTFEGEMCSFPFIASAVYPDSNLEDWM